MPDWTSLHRALPRRDLLDLALACLLYAGGGATWDVDPDPAEEGEETLGSDWTLATGEWGLALGS